ncbi:MAG: primary-amine oxidase [Gammaproteobacteria bacterium]
MIRLSNKGACLLFIIALSACGCSSRSDHAHPLDPLSAQEIEATRDTLHAAGKISETSRFKFIHLREPPKQEVLAYHLGDPLLRKAFAVVYDWASNTTAEAIVDLSHKVLLSWKVIRKAQPGLLQDDHRLTEEIVRGDPRWRAAMFKRGITNLSSVKVRGYPMGSSAPAERDGSRLAIALTLYKSAPGIWGRIASFLGLMPKQGRALDDVLVWVNLTTKKVLHFEDKGHVSPRPPPSELYHPSALPSTQAQRYVSAARPGFEVRGYQVRWKKWRFRFGMDPRVGLVLYMVEHEDQGRYRSILYRASLSEMVVPYGDPSWRIWNPLDAGEFGLGVYGRSSMSKGGEAPNNAVFFSSVVPNERGAPLEVPRAIALYERDGGVLWRHGNEVQRAEHLVLSFYTQIDNYDYGFSWVFHQDGALEMEALLTGAVLWKAVSRSTDSSLADDESTHGRLVGRHIEAPIHQHFFNFRLDLDVDGQMNSVLELNTIVKKGDPASSGFPSVVVKQTLFEREQQAQRRISLLTQRSWKTINPAAHNRLGQPTAYVLVAGENALPIAPPNSYLRRKAGFVNRHVWVTAYDESEIYAAGEYVNLGPLGEGLPAWTQANRGIANTDLVLWYTLGVTHMPRPEEWPVMPVSRAGFKLTPSGFFSLNPALSPN